MKVLREFLSDKVKVSQQKAKRTHKKRTKFCHLQQCGWTWRALHQVKCVKDNLYVESKKYKRLVNATKKKPHRY